MVVSRLDVTSSAASRPRKIAFALLCAFILAVACTGRPDDASALGMSASDRCTTAPHPDKCRRARAAKAARAGATGDGAAPGQAQPARKSPAIEVGGTMPALDNTVPLLRAGTFRLDMSGFYATYPAFGLGNVRPNGPSSSILETLTLGYGVNERFTIFGGAIESNSSHGTNGYSADFVDPRIGFVYRVVQPKPFLWGTAVDFVGDVALNEPLSPGSPSFSPYGDLGPIVRARVLATRDFGHGFTLQVNGGFQAAVSMAFPFGSLPGQNTEVDALLGLAGQYRLSAISDRLYVNGEIDWLKPVTDNNNQFFIASPFRTAENYSATLGASYVVKPGFLIARVTDTVALSVVNGNNLLPPTGPRHFVSNTVGMTLSFVNLTPQNWLRGLAH